MNVITANIFDIKRFGINDGAGIRTVFFIKGCPLKCLWCHNPEGLSTHINLWVTRHSCMGCRRCILACPQKNLDWDEQGVKIGAACVGCGQCVSACPTGALRFDARAMTVEEALAEVEKDRVFYETSGGGVTLSGGECTMSPGFSLALLAACKERGIDTAIETCLHTGAETLQSFCRVADRIIADIKLADPIAHKAAVGVDNSRILANLRMLAETECDLLLRIPLIPGFTATQENIRAIGGLIGALPRPIPVELINYNPMGREKYETLRKAYPINQNRPLDAAQVNEYKALLTGCGLEVL